MKKSKIIWMTSFTLLLSFAIKHIVGITPSHPYRIGLWFWSDLVDKVHCMRSVGLSFLMQVGPVSSWILQQLGHSNLYLWRQLLPSYLYQSNGYCNISKTWLYQLQTIHNLSLIFPRFFKHSSTISHMNISNLSK